MAEALAREIPFESRRVPLERRITLKFQHREGFINEYAANISLKGMFITAWVPEPCGSVFLFEVQVADRQLLIHGVGEVVWVREAEERPDRPAGMGVRFLKLDSASREVISSMVESHIARGGTPFDPAVGPDGSMAVEELFDEGRRATEPGAEPGAVSRSEPEPGPAAASDEDRLGDVVLDPRLGPFAGRAMSRRRRRGRALLWTTLAALLGGSAALVLLT